MAQLLRHDLLHESVVVAQDPQLPLSYVQFVEQLATLLGDFGVDQLVDVAEELLALAAVVKGRLLLHVEQVLVLCLPDVLGLNPGAQLGLSILEQALAERLQAVIEVLHREHYPRSARESLDLRAAVPQFREESLDEVELVEHVQVAVLIDTLV
jgi:hypothetical protein